MQMQFGPMYQKNSSISKISKKSKNDRACVNLCSDDRAMPSCRAVSAAMEAALWDTSGACRFEYARKRTATDRLHEIDITNRKCSFLCSAVAELLRARAGAGSGSGSGFDLPLSGLGEDSVFINSGERTDMISLGGRLPENTKIYIPLPASRATVNAANGYFLSPRYFTPADPLRAPLPCDLPDDFPTEDSMVCGTGCAGKDATPVAVFLCSPSDATGVAFERAGIVEWVEFAIKRRILLIFDATLSPFVREYEEIGRYVSTIYEIPGAVMCAAEVCSLLPSWQGGIRCGYSVLPDTEFFGRLRGIFPHCAEAPSGAAVSYMILRGAAGVFSPEGINESRRRVEYYRRGARRLAAALAAVGFEPASSVGVSPYVFMRSRGEYRDDGELCRALLENYGIEASPGSDFGLESSGHGGFACGDKESGGTSDTKNNNEVKICYFRVSAIVSPRELDLAVSGI